MSPSHRMMAALTPSSLALSRTARTIWDTAYSPNTEGPNTVRASSTPTAKLLTRTTMVFSMLHRVPDRTRLSRSWAGCSAGARTRGRSDAAIGYSGGSRTTASAGPIASATRPGRRCAPAPACRTATYTVRSRKASDSFEGTASTLKLPKCAELLPRWMKNAATWNSEHVGQHLSQLRAILRPCQT